MNTSIPPIDPSLYHLSVPPLMLRDSPDPVYTFLFIYEKETSFEELAHLIGAYIQTFEVKEPVCLCIYLRDPHFDLNLIKTTIQKTSIDLESIPEIVVLEEKNIPISLPELFAACDTFIYLSETTELQPNLLRALAMDKSLLMLDTPFHRLYFNENVAFFIEYSQLVLQFRSVFQAERKQGLRAYFLEHFWIQPDQSAHAYTSQALTLYQRGEIKQAEQLALEILNQKKLVGTKEQLLTMGNLFIETKRLNIAIEIFHLICKDRPEYVPAHFYSGKILLDSGILEEAAWAFKEVLYLDPQHEIAHNLLKQAHQRIERRKRIPPIFINAFFRSGSEYLTALLCKGLDAAHMEITTRIGLTRDSNTFVYDKVQKLLKQGGIAKEHLSSTPANIYLTSKFFDKMIVHVRDPRSGIVTNILSNQILREKRKQAQTSFGVWLEMESLFTDWNPDYYHSLSLPPKEQIDYWLNTELYEQSIQDLVGWLEAAETYADSLQILFSDYSQLLNNERDLIESCLTFYGLDPEKDFIWPDPSKEGGSAFSANPDQSSIHYSVRKRDPDEWRQVMTPEQARKATDLIPDCLFEKFGWSRAYIKA